MIFKYILLILLFICFIINKDYMIKVCSIISLIVIGLILLNLKYLLLFNFLSIIHNNFDNIVEYIDNLVFRY